MPDTVPVTLDLDPETAAALDDAATRARILRLIRRTALPGNPERLFAAMDALSADAWRRGLTDEILEAELAAHRAQRLGAPNRA